MSERNNDDEYEPVIRPSTGIRISVGLIALMVVSFGYFLFSRDEIFRTNSETRFAAHEKRVDEELDELHEKIETKASKQDAADRFTATQFREYRAIENAKDKQFTESIEQRLQLIQEKNDVEHSSLLRAVDAVDKRVGHTQEDLREAVQRIDTHYTVSPRK